MADNLKRTADQFNTDPKHETERTEFDKLVEGSLNRIGERKKKTSNGNGEEKSKGGTFVDGLLESLFGAESEE